MTDKSEWKAVRQLVDNKHINLTTDEDGVIIGSDKWVYNCTLCSKALGKDSKNIYSHFLKNHDEIIAMMGLANL